MRRLLESLTPGERPISWTWIGGMFAFYVVVMATAVTLYVGHQTRANLAQKTGATVATGSAREPGMQRSLQHVVHYAEDARVWGSD
jgi:hypothetical protein